MVFLRFFAFSVFWLIATTCAGLAQIQPDIVLQADKAMGRTLVDVGNNRQKTGSGFVLSEAPGGGSYYYITNHHVTSGGRDIQVGFKQDDRVFLYDARLMHSSRELDLAVLKIVPLDPTAHRPGFLSLREGELLKGEQVAAIGYPGSSDQVNAGGDMLPYFETTLTQGAISKVAPGSFNETGRTLEIVQHTASVNPGNSGGPLIDYCGSVLGINTVISVWNSDGRTPTNNTFWASSSNPITSFLRGVDIPFTAHQRSCDPSDPDMVIPGESDGNLLIILAVLCGAGAAVLGGIYLMVSRGRNKVTTPMGRAGRGNSVDGPPILVISLDGTSERITAAQLRAGVTIGRASENTLTFGDRNLSRTHASLSLDGRKMMLADLGSSNGTKVDGRRLKANTPVQINTKSKVELGGVALVLKRP